MQDYEKLYKRYLNQQAKLSFTKEQIEDLIIKKFKAEEFLKTEVLDLVNDDQLEYSKIYKCFVVNDPKILNKNFSIEEKKYHNEQILDNRENPLDFKKVKKKEHNYNHLLIDEQEGRRVDIFLESKNGKYITNFIVRDRSEEISRYLNALVLGTLIQNGIADIPEDIKDDEFQFYLENLYRFGFLD
ncbi:tRNA U54 and U55 pseudouridine synthase Pus10 [Bacillus pakistanensis]|uniref:tRNA U54 and U55 pseudouridine synthase Pus10 n=1 Tax=Rossellomorea pakistanensis TaxID=992288 RepID=A0ABS2N9X8_9BACI|nr:hypothetical protein [Bacillus pakistanensis]MBM7584652.1 tRNA U54 and U55 pseudouridine synthase Pus10 [Bacillus pakistanensis]